MPPTDVLELRSALGKFATGVTIVTTRGRDGAPFGVTASSFNSVSLDPPLILWSLSNTSKSMEAFSTAEHFCVHVLSADQELLSNRFASRGGEKFAEVAWERGIDDVPLLPDCAARFVCQTAYRYEGGDHTIFVGRVLDFTRCDKAPLLFHGGRYAEAKQRIADARTSVSIDLSSGLMSSDFFLYLLPAAYFHATYPIRALLDELGVTYTENLVLATISNNGALSEEELKRRLDYTGYGPDAADIAAMETKGWIAAYEEGSAYRLTTTGRDLFLHVLTRMKAHEEWLLSRFASHEIVDAKALLSRIIDASAEMNRIPAPWEARP